MFCILSTKRVTSLALVSANNNKRMLPDWFFAALKTAAERGVNQPRSGSVMDRKIFLIWLVTLGIALSEALMGFLPRYIGALLPMLLMSLSFYVFRKLPLGYRIFHLLFVAQFLLYVIFIMLFSYKNLFESGFQARLAYSSFTNTTFVYTAFLFLFLLVYAPYFFLQKRKKATIGKQTSIV